MHDQSDGIVVTIFSLLKYLDKYAVMVSRRSETSSKTPTSNQETATFMFPRMRPLRIDGYIKGSNIKMTKKPMILFSRIPSKNWQKPIKLTADAMKTGTTPKTWMRMTTDGNRNVRVIIFETVITRETVRRENK